MSATDPSIPTSTIEYYRALPVPEAAPPPPRYWLHALLLVATCFTTLVVGARMEFNFQHNLPPLSDSGGFIPFFPVEWVVAQPSRLLLGIPFAGTLLVILLAHEMGHYLLCRYYGVRATLPYFIPAPTLIGTLGAVIRIKAPIRSRTALFDIGIAGPIAGFVVAVVTLIVAMTLSKPLIHGVGPSDLQLGFPAVFYVVQAILRGVEPGHVIASLPLSRIYLHPTAIAAWVGMFATALNLLPSGQLDGGHIVYALAPRAHRAISWITVLVLLYLGLHNVSWRVWAGLIIVMNVLTFRHRQAPNYPDLPASRWTLALLAFIMLALTFTISPFQLVIR
ncbi:MAG TPA: site-2 protease family protein [Candidatus Dormibacteraeota bacterium]|nr:site-2 protease family protein [Candidatus Dormibacteraeota bacterium]